MEGGAWAYLHRSGLFHSAALFLATVVGAHSRAKVRRTILGRRPLVCVCMLSRRPKQHRMGRPSHAVVSFAYLDQCIVRGRRVGFGLDPDGSLRDRGGRSWDNYG